MTDLSIRFFGPTCCDLSILSFYASLFFPPARLCVKYLFPFRIYLNGIIELNGIYGSLCFRCSSFFLHLFSLVTGVFSITMRFLPIGNLGSTALHEPLVERNYGWPLWVYMTLQFHCHPGWNPRIHLGPTCLDQCQTHCHTATFFPLIVTLLQIMRKYMAMSVWKVLSSHTMAVY